MYMERQFKEQKTRSLVMSETQQVELGKKNPDERT